MTKVEWIGRDVVQREEIDKNCLKEQIEILRRISRRSVYNI